MSLADKLNQIAANEPLVYEAGKKSQYDEFWDIYQQLGNKSSGNQMFANGGWTDITFNPKYSMANLTNCNNMFNTSKITDLKGILESKGLTFDFKRCGNMQNLIAYSTITRCPVVNGSNASGFNQFAQYAEDLVSIDQIVLKTDGTQTFTNAFLHCYALEEIRFTGKIGRSISFGDSSKLSRASIENIFSVLYISDTTTTEQTLTLSLAAVNKAFETSTDANDGSTSAAYLALYNARPSGWQVTLST